MITVLDKLSCAWYSLWYLCDAWHYANGWASDCWNSWFYQLISATNIWNSSLKRNRVWRVFIHKQTRCIWVGVFCCLSFKSFMTIFWNFLWNGFEKLFYSLFRKGMWHSQKSSWLVLKSLLETSMGEGSQWQKRPIWVFYSSLFCFCILLTLHCISGITTFIILSLFLLFSVISSAAGCLLERLGLLCTRWCISYHCYLSRTTCFAFEGVSHTCLWLIIVKP